MDNSKEIGQAFKERMQSMKKSPDNQIWEKIASQMDQKEKKKRRFIIPFWYKVSGIAVLVVLLFTVSKNNFVKDSINKENPVNTTVTSVEKDSAILPKTETNESKITVNEKTKFNSKSNNTSKEDLPQTIYKEQDNLLTDNKKDNEFLNNTKKTLISNNNDIIRNNDSTKIISTEKTIANTKIKNVDFKNNIQSNDSILHNQQKIDLTENQSDSEENPNPKKSKHSKRMEIYINVAPVSYNSLTKGSSLSSAFYENAKKSVITSSYGINLGVSVSNRIKIKSGINQLNLSYITEEVFQNEISSSQIITPNELYLNSISDGVIVEYNTYNLVQRLTYLEIPMEIQYTVLDKKLNVRMLSGFSTLILEKNSVDIEQTSIGTANNLNKLSLTGNIGMNFNYGFNNDWGFFMEPVLKFQLNPYNSFSTDFKPYILGINFGIAKKL